MSAHRAYLYLVVGRQRQAAAAVRVDEVLGNGAALAEDQRRAAAGVASVFDDGRGAERVHLLQLLGRPERVALVEFEGVGNAELLAEPDDALGLASPHVVHDERHRGKSLAYTLGVSVASEENRWISAIVARCFNGHRYRMSFAACWRGSAGIGP